jgi:hypothetical protein
VKRRSVIAFLVLFAVWPAVHRALVAGFDVNPWKLGGWAMYARPHFPPELRVYVVRGGSERRLGRLTAWEQLLADELVERRFTLGELASADDLAHALLERTRGDGVAIELRTRFLDPATSRIAERVERRVVGRPPS